MTPLYNGNDYYKKMLDLQERLRKSEEERIRLEERFSLLEHESRSRHETCINRLRMRYIDFLEEQQARDERNHQLLGALDRVDTSLALMSAKTDRLGALRKQYEASILLAPYENRRPNGSVTGDSGVASQNDERQRGCGVSLRGNRVNEALVPARSLAVQGNAVRTNNSPSQVRPGLSYGSTWSGIRCESSQMHQPSFALSRFPEGGTTSLARDNGSSLASFVVNSPDKLRGFTRLRATPDPRESVLQSLRYRTPVTQSLPAYDHNNPSRYSRPEYPLLRNTEASIPVSSLKYGRTVIRDLANSGAYETPCSPAVPRFLDDSKGHFGDSNPYEQEKRGLPGNDLVKVPRRNSTLSLGQGSSLEDRRILASSPSPRSPRLSEIIRQELGDDEEEEYIGSIVENQLERYISKIRSLHRDAEPQSIEEIDHEQNTSGDLLNVTLSDDGLEFSAEEKSRERSFPRAELENVLALANDLANQTATSVINVTNNIRQDITAGDHPVGSKIVTNEDAKFVDEQSRHTTRGSKNNEPTSASDGVHQLPSINRLPAASVAESYEDANLSSFERLELLAKNGISADVAKPRVELAPRSDKNIQDIAKLARNSRDCDEGKNVSRRVVGSNDEVDDDDKTKKIHETNVSSVSEIEEKGDKFSRRSSTSLRQRLQESRYSGVMNGEERETDENLHDIAEDLEPWNLSALERRVQEIILNDEAQNDFIRRGISRRDVDEKLRRSHELEHMAILRVNDELDEPPVDGRKIDECIAGNEETEDSRGSWKNDDAGTAHGTSAIGESPAGYPTKSKEDLKLEEYEEGSSAVAEESINQFSQEDTKGSHEEDNIGETSYPASGDNLVDPSIEYEAREVEKDYTNQKSYVQDEYPEDPNLQYAYNGDGEYQGDPNEQYQQYSADPNQQYPADPNQQYPVDPNQQYPADSNQQYPADPNQQYPTDPNQQYPADPDQQYTADPNQQYPTDPNQQYPADPDQQYTADPDQQYTADPDQQYTADPNQQYPTDPNQQYPTDPNQQYPANPDQHYTADPNLQYPEDPNQQYSADPNQQYPEDPNQQYSADANQQYTGDPNLQYPEDPNQQYPVDPNQQYAADPNQQYPADPNEQYPADPNQQFTSGPNQLYPADPNQQYSADPDQHYTADPNLQYPEDPNQQYPANPSQHYAADPNQEYSADVDPNQKYPQDAGYAQGENQGYPTVSIDYPYPEAREYPSNEGHFQGPEGSTVANGSEESVLHQDSSKVMADREGAIENELELSASLSETKISTKEEKTTRKTKDVIKSLLDSDTESTIERNVSNTESDFDFN